MRQFYENRLNLLKAQNFELDFDFIDVTTVFDRSFMKSSNQNICLIGEAPGENEVKAGVPFCGQAGKNLSELIKISGLQREQFCITNGFCFRTFKPGVKGAINRTPNTKELRAGAFLLAMELELLRPKMIVLLGLSALKAFSYLHDKSLINSLSKLERNRITESFSDILQYRVLIAHTYHPSPLVYNQKEKKLALQEFFKSLYL